jgi:hypothetical protein
VRSCCRFLLRRRTSFFRSAMSCFIIMISLHGAPSVSARLAEPKSIHTRVDFSRERCRFRKINLQFCAGSGGDSRDGNVLLYQ